jgi:hypothetical protein
MTSNDTYLNLCDSGNGREKKRHNMLSPVEAERMWKYCHQHFTILLNIECSIKEEHICVNIARVVLSYFDSNKLANV